MRAPEFWNHRGAAAALLAPFACGYALAGRLRRSFATPWTAPVPVICIGNITAGGAGKTPLTIALTRVLQQRGFDPHVLSRGYGGTLAEPQRVDETTHQAIDVGDEPLLLARVAPTWIGADRTATARLAAKAGADVLLMDDGFQNPGLAKTVSILAVDGGYGFGNGRVIPAGPLREPLADGLARADAAVIVGIDAAQAQSEIAGRCPVYGARIVPVADDEIAGRTVFAFAGIGRPEKFFVTLLEMGCTIAGQQDFADHHRFTADEIMDVCDRAEALGALPVTTEKDFVRLPPDARQMVRPVRIALQWAEEDAPERLLAPVLDAARTDGTADG